MACEVCMPPKSLAVASSQSKGDTPQAAERTNHIILHQSSLPSSRIHSNLWREQMKRRTFLTGGAAAAAGLITQPAASHYYDNEWVKSPPAQPLAPSDLEAAVARLRKQFLAEFDAAYVENVIVPHFLVSIYEGERLFLPMIDVEFTKENALPFDLWGLLSETWKPAPEFGV